MEDQLVISGVINMARMWEAPARAMGRPWVRWDDAWAADSELPSRFFSRVIVVRRLDPAAAPGLAGRIHEFYASHPDGGPYVVVDTWATIDLEPHGFKRAMTLPFMVRLPGGPAGPRPTREIREARSDSDLADFVHVVVEGFGIAELTDVPASRVMDERVLEERPLRLWVAYEEGRPVGTSAAYVADGVVGVYLVGVVPDMRRKGIGEALTWQATLVDRASPCTLQASTGGRPIYERMGYVTAAECAMWISKNRRDR